MTEPRIYQHPARDSFVAIMGEAAFEATKNWDVTQTNFSWYLAGWDKKRE